MAQGVPTAGRWRVGEYGSRAGDDRLGELALGSVAAKSPVLCEVSIPQRHITRGGRADSSNEWSASAPQVAVHLLESWAPILPAFIHDNILDQLILPKVRQAMEEWDGRSSRSGKTRSLSSIVFPWLPLLGHRMEEVLEAAKRRIRHVMRKWVVRDGVPEELSRWRKDVSAPKQADRVEPADRQIFSSKEWDDLMLRTVVPKLGVCLRDDFSINPRKQDMVPLEDWVMPWHTLLRSSVFSSLLEVNFFPKWLDILYIWLVQPNFKADEVANWYVPRT